MPAFDLTVPPSLRFPRLPLASAACRRRIGCSHGRDQCCPPSTTPSPAPIRSRAHTSPAQACPVYPLAPLSRSPTKVATANEVTDCSIDRSVTIVVGKAIWFGHTRRAARSCEALRATRRHGDRVRRFVQVADSVARAVVAGGTRAPGPRAHHRGRPAQAPDDERSDRRIPPHARGHDPQQLLHAAALRRVGLGPPGGRACGRGPEVVVIVTA